MADDDFEDEKDKMTRLSGGVEALTTRQMQAKFVMDSVRGDGGYLTGDYLFPHPREEAPDYTARKRMAFLRNYLSGVVDSVIKPVFSTPPIRKYNSDMVGAFIGNCDNKGTSLENFVKASMRSLRPCSVYFVIMDNFKEIPKTEAEAIKFRKFPYVYGRGMEHVYDYTLDDFDNIKAISFFYKMMIVSESGSSTEIPVYIEYTKEYTALFYLSVKEKKYIKDKMPNSLVDANNNPITPVMRIAFNAECNEFLPKPDFYDLAKLQLSIYNQDSEQRTLERQCAFVVLQIPTDDDIDGLEIGSNNVIATDPESSQVASFIAPPAENLKSIRESADSYVVSFSEQAHSVGAVPVNASETKSGKAYAFEFLGQSFALQDVATVSALVEKTVIKYFGLYNKTTYEYEVKYNDNFMPSIDEIERKITLLLQVLAEMGLSETVRKSIQYDIGVLIMELGKYDKERSELFQKKLTEEANSTI